MELTRRILHIGANKRDFTYIIIVSKSISTPVVFPPSMTKLDMSIPSHKHPLHRLQLSVIICIRIYFFWKELEFLNHLQLSFWQSLWSISLQNYEKGRHNLRALASTITVELYPFVRRLNPSYVDRLLV
jgi:hypothetical protein